MSTLISRGTEGEIFLSLSTSGRRSKVRTQWEDSCKQARKRAQPDPDAAGSLTSHSSLQNLRKHIPAIQAPPVSFVRVVGAAVAAKSLQSCPTLCNPIDGSPWGSTVPGILQARTLEWVAISFFNAWKWKVKVKLFSCVRLFVTPWTAAYRAPLSMGFSRQEYRSGLPSLIHV